MHSLMPSEATRNTRSGDTAPQGVTAVDPSIGDTVQIDKAGKDFSRHIPNHQKSDQPASITPNLMNDVAAVTDNKIGIVDVAVLLTEGEIRPDIDVSRVTLDRSAKVTDGEFARISEDLVPSLDIPEQSPDDIQEFAFGQPIGPSSETVKTPVLSTSSEANPKLNLYERPATKQTPPATIPLKEGPVGLERSNPEPNILKADSALRQPSNTPTDDSIPIDGDRLEAPRVEKTAEVKNAASNAELKPLAPNTETSRTNVIADQKNELSSRHTNETEAPVKTDVRASRDVADVRRSEMIDIRQTDIASAKTPMTSASISESLAKVQTTPILAPTPNIVPMSGLSERLVVSLTQAGQPNTAVPIDRIPHAVVTVALNGDRTTLQIDPPELGRIQLDYQFDTQGRTVVTLVPETEAARAALAERIVTITQTLQQSLSGSVDVNVGDTQDFTTGDGPAFGQYPEGSGGDGNNDPTSAGSNSSSLSSISVDTDHSVHSILSDGSERLHILV